MTTTPRRDRRIIAVAIVGLLLVVAAQWFISDTLNDRAISAERDRVAAERDARVDAEQKVQALEGLKAATAALRDQCRAGVPSACDQLVGLDALPAPADDPERQDDEIQQDEIQNAEIQNAERQEREVDQPEPDDPERQDGEVDQPEPDDPDFNDPETDDPERQDDEVQNDEQQDAELDDPEAQEDEQQDEEVQDTEIDDPEIQDDEIQDAEVDDPDPGTTCDGDFVCTAELDAAMQAAIATALADYFTKGDVLALFRMLGCETDKPQLVTCTITGLP